MTFEKLQAEMDEALQFPGFPNTWTQPIRNRLDMLFTGIKTPVGIKILGPDLAVIQRLGQQIEGILQAVRRHAQRLRRAGDAGLLHRHPDRARRHRALRPDVEDVQDVIQTAHRRRERHADGRGARTLPVNVRYERDLPRATSPALERVLVPDAVGRRRCRSGSSRTSC